MKYYKQLDNELKGSLTTDSFQQDAVLVLKTIFFLRDQPVTFSLEINHLLLYMLRW